jgi:hypothetical protein
MRRGGQDFVVLSGLRGAGGDRSAKGLAVFLKGLPVSRDVWYEDGVDRC